jgi:DNA polymerase-1
MSRVFGGVMKQLFKKTRRVALFDFSNVVFRATATGGEFYLNRFCHMMVKYRKKLGSQEFVFAIEGKGTDERRKLYPAYKEGRYPSEELIESRKRCRSILRCTDCTIVKAPLGEADDAIACYLHEEAPSVATIVSEDKDLWQLIRPGKYLVMSSRRGTVTPETVRAVLGVPPSKIGLHKAVLGDSADGIPRVPRVPKKLLLQLVQDSANVKELLRNAKELPEKHAQKIAACKTQIRTNYKLVRLKTALPMKRWKYKPDETKLRKRLAKHDVTLSDRDVTILLRGVNP